MRGRGNAEVEAEVRHEYWICLLVAATGVLWCSAGFMWLTRGDLVSGWCDVVMGAVHVGSAIWLWAKVPRLAK